MRLSRLFLRLCLPVAVALTAWPLHAETTTKLRIAEQHLAECAANVESHPPYGPRDPIIEACQRETDEYIAACGSAGSHSSIECSMAAYTLAHSVRRVDPVDQQFVACLRQAALSHIFPLELLTICRAERDAFGMMCRRRKDATQCDEDMKALAVASCILSGKSDEVCRGDRK